MTYLSYQDLADRFGVSTNTLYVWKHRGKLPEPDVGRGYWKASTIDRLVAKGQLPEPRST